MRLSGYCISHISWCVCLNRNCATWKHHTLISLSVSEPHQPRCETFSEICVQDTPVPASRANKRATKPKNHESYDRSIERDSIRVPETYPSSPTLYCPLLFTVQDFIRCVCVSCVSSSNKSKRYKACLLAISSRVELGNPLSSIL